MLNRITNYLILLFLFLLPFQARWIYKYGFLNNRPWEFGTLSLYGTEILLWLIVILTGIKLFGRVNFWRKIVSVSHLKTHWKNLLAALMFLLCALIFIRSGNPISWQFATWFLGGLCLTVAIAVSGLSFSRAAPALWLGGIIQGLLAIQQFFYQKVIGSKWLGMAIQDPRELGVSVVQFGEERWLRAYGSFGWPNSLGIYLAVVFILGLILYFYPHTKKASSVGDEKNDLVGVGVYFIRPKYRPLIMLGQMVILMGLILSFSRSGWWAAFGGLIVFVIITLRNYRAGKAAEPRPTAEPNRRKFLWHLSQQLLVYGVLITAVVMVYRPVFFARFNTDNFFEKLSIVERTEQIKVARQVIETHPFLGVGPGLYTDYLSKNYPKPNYGQYQPVHNIYLLSLAELGVFVFLCFCVLMFWFIRKISRFGPIYLSVLAVLALAGFYDHFLWSLYAGQMVWWAVFALGLLRPQSTVTLDKRLD